MDFEFSSLLLLISRHENTQVTYNTCYVCKFGALKGKKIMAVYTPLIDLAPADPKTIMTAMIEAKK